MLEHLLFALARTMGGILPALVVTAHAPRAPLSVENTLVVRDRSSCSISFYSAMVYCFAIQILSENSERVRCFAEL